MTEINSRGKKGRDFYHNNEYVSFEKFRKFETKDIERLQSGFAQSIVFGMQGANEYDVLELHRNYSVFINNSKLLNKIFSLRKHWLLQTIYEEWKLKDFYYKKDKENGAIKLEKAPINELNPSKKNILELEKELLKLEEVY